MSLIVLPYIFSSGTTIVASQTNSNNSTFLTAINGGLDNTNLTGSAGITYANLTLGGNIVNADIFTAANISTSKLNLGALHQGDIFYDNGTTNLTRLTPGSAGKFLQTQGASANPIWAGTSFVPNNIQIFTLSGTWINPGGITQVYVKVIGAGGNGGTAGSGGNLGGMGSNGSINLNGFAGNFSSAYPAAATAIYLVFGSGGLGATNILTGGQGGYAEGIVSVTGNVTVTIGSTNSFAGTTTIQATAGGNGGNGSSGLGNTGAVIVYY